MLLKSPMRPNRSARLVRGHVIEDRKERSLASLLRIPMSGIAVFVPRFFDEPGDAARIVIRLHIVGGIVAGFSKIG